MAAPSFKLYINTPGKSAMALSIITLDKLNSYFVATEVLKLPLTVKAILVCPT